MTVYETIRRLPRNAEIEIWSDHLLLFQGYADEVLDDPDFQHEVVIATSLDPYYDLLIHI